MLTWEHQSEIATSIFDPIGPSPRNDGAMITLQITSSPDECLKRLRAVSEASRLINDPFRKDRTPLVMREVKGEILILRNRRYNNSLQPILRLRLQPDGKGTKLTGRFEIHVFNFWLLAGWYAYLFFVLFFKAPSPGVDPGVVYRFGLNTGLAMGAPALVWALGAYLARGEKEFLVDALKECLNIKP